MRPSTVMKWYLAGPMSGYDQQNFPLFDRVAKTLREQGYDIVSPAELDSPEERAIALANARSASTWGDFLSRDVKIIADQVQGIIFLPDWSMSRGARLEATVGLLQPEFEFRMWNDAAQDTYEVGRCAVAYDIFKGLLR
jgi:hypothetical protein